jgi:hypothetical protein
MKLLDSVAMRLSLRCPLIQMQMPDHAPVAGHVSAGQVSTLAMIDWARKHRKIRVEYF